MVIQRSMRLLALLLFVPILPAGAVAAEPNPAQAVDPPLKPEEKAHWAYQPPRRPTLPKVQAESWVRTPMDLFVLARLEKNGLQPAPAVDRAAWLRRVTFDLLGLPPTPRELDTFLGDTSPDARERVVERLLASPHYGERWAQHWLDVVRYAESNGFEIDSERTHAWRYRDYVIRALNDDKPYDQFLREQLAGDLLARGKDNRQHADLLIATGLNRCGPVHLVSGNTDPDVNRQEVLTEMTNTVGSAILGMTIGCARCHNHKFDPVSQADYYRLQAFFAAAQPRDIEVAAAEEKQAYEKQVQELNRRLAPLRKQVADLDEPYKSLLTELKKATLEPKYRDALEVEAKKRTPQQQQLAQQAANLIRVTWDEVVEALGPEERARRAAWRSQIHDLEARMPPPPAHAWAIASEDTVPPTHVLKRGDPKRQGPPVLAAFPRVLGSLPGSPPAGSQLDRAALARWLTRPDHPLTARVLVNRLWQHHFGAGLVATPNDFGFRGAPPSHPELLDWLASELVSHDWSIKHLHRLMMLSSTYRQSSRVSAYERARQVDPGNRLLWRMNRRRLEGEALRDSALAVSGALNPKVGGPMVRVPLEPEVYQLIFTEGEPDGLWPVTPDVREHSRRSIYLFAKRNLPLPLLEAFDRPDTLTSCPVRPVSTFTPQALILLNGPFMQEQSQAFAARLLRDCGPNADRLMGRAYSLAMGRLARAAELRLGREFFAEQVDRLRARLQAGEAVALPSGLAAGTDPAMAAALADFCLALLNCNEFLYVE